jgi:glycolate oxidase FAD binding subunit
MSLIPWNLPVSPSGFDRVRWIFPMPILNTSSVEEKLRSVVGPQHLRPATTSDMVSGMMPKFVAEPEDERQLAALLALANESGVAVIPRGGGTKLGWGNPPERAGLMLSTRRLNRIREHAWADLTVTVEAGCTFQALQEALSQHGQRLACDCLWPDRATIGGVLSANDSGALRLRFGALRDLIIGVTLALADGTLASSGGKVVKNVAGYDLPKLATGAFGTLGVITRAVFRLHPLPRNSKTITFAAEDFHHAQNLILSIQDSKLAHTALQVRGAAGSRPHLDILFEATDSGIEAQELHLRKLLGATLVEQSSELVWNARQALWSSTNGPVVAKIGILPAEIAKLVKVLEQIAGSKSLPWQIVAQATGITTLRLEGQPARLAAAVELLRAGIATTGGSFVALRQPKELESQDVWGNAGDAIALMRAVKQQFDPKSTLNPGRFVGRI